MTSQRSKILITGSSGFLGSAIIQNMLANDFEVRGLYRTPRRNINQKIQAITVCGSIHEWTKVIVDEKPSTLILCDWQGTSTDDRLLTSQDSNAIRWQKLAGVALNEGARKIIAIGSQAELGTMQIDVDEETAFSPRTPYGHAKKDAFERLKDLVKTYDADLIWARTFSVYGNQMSPQLFLPKIIDSIFSGEELKTSPLTQYWNYLHINDWVDAILKLQLLGENGIYNVASADSILLSEVVDIVSKLIGKPNTVKKGTLPLRLEDTQIMRPNVQKIMDLGWKEKVKLSEGLRDLIAHRMGKNNSMFV